MALPKESARHGSRIVVDKASAMPLIMCHALPSISSRESTMWLLRRLYIESRGIYWYPLTVMVDPPYWPSIPRGFIHYTMYKVHQQSNLVYYCHVLSHIFYKYYEIVILKHSHWLLRNGSSSACSFAQRAIVSFHKIAKIALSLLKIGSLTCIIMACTDYHNLFKVRHTLIGWSSVRDRILCC